MLRSFRSQDFIQLPHLDEAGTLALAGDLEAAAKGTPKVPSPVLASLARLLETCTALKKQIGLRERAGSSADPRARAADRALDDAWGAFQTWLLGWTRLPDRAHPRVADARIVYAKLFPKGLQFLTLEFKDEWKESQERLDAIGKGKLDELIAALGGAPFLETLSRAHGAYGEALNLTSGQPRGASETDAAIGKALEAAHMALRDYVAQVAATVRRDEPETVGVADRLLAPLSARALKEEELVDEAHVLSGHD